MPAQFFNHARIRLAYILKGILTFCLYQIDLEKRFKKQARKSSEDAQAAGYARFEKVWAK